MITSTAALAEDDRRREHPRFAQENLERNLALLETLRAVAAAQDSTPAQVALAWLLHQGDEVVPIPGTKRRRYVEENVRALNLRLHQAKLAKLDQAFPPGITAGERYPAGQMKRVGI